MIDVSPLASEKLSAYLVENNIDSPVRITAMNSCRGASLGLALDERKDGDLVLALGGVTMLIDPDLSAACGKVTLDYQEETGASGGGFALRSERALPNAGGGCGGSCASGGCGC